jgi:hypothetical protein
MNRLGQRKHLAMPHREIPGGETGCGKHAEGTTKSLLTAQNGARLLTAKPCSYPSGEGLTPLECWGALLTS